MKAWRLEAFWKDDSILLVEQEGVSYIFYISNQRAALDLCERLCGSFELLDRLVVALFGVVVNSQFYFVVIVSVVSEVQSSNLGAAWTHCKSRILPCRLRLVLHFPSGSEPLLGHVRQPSRLRYCQP